MHTSYDQASGSAGGVQPTVYLYSARALRDFGDGFVAVLLPVYLTALGFSPLQVGIIATAALLGSALLLLLQFRHLKPPEEQ